MASAKLNVRLATQADPAAVDHALICAPWPTVDLIRRLPAGMREIWVDQALSPAAARCGPLALRQRRIATLKVIAINGVDMHANRVARIVGLSARRGGDHGDCQHRASQYAHREFLRVKPDRAAVRSLIASRNETGKPGIESGKHEASELIPLAGQPRNAVGVPWGIDGPA